MQASAIVRDTSAVTGAIQLAAAQSGVDFGYLYAQAKLESGLNPDARAATSSARGLYQFTASTWLDTVRKHGADYGLGEAAAALRHGADAATKAAVLDLRRNPQVAAQMAGALAADNRTHLEAGLGRPATATDLYLAHFLGASGALRFLRAHAVDPSASGAALAPAAAHANRAVFSANDDRPRSLAAIYDRFAVKLGGTALPISGNNLPVRVAALPPAPQSARLAYLQLAEISI